MKILRLRDYYYPEIVASSHLSDDMDEAYAENDFFCINITPIPTRGISNDIYQKYRNIKYEEKYGGKIIIKRFSVMREGKKPLQRMIRYFICSIIEYFKALKEKDIDVVYGGSTPPTQGMLCALVRKALRKKYKRNVAFVYNLQDIFPDSLVNAGFTKKGSLVWRIGRRIENYTYKNADIITVINNNMKKNIIEKGVNEEKIRIIPNWIDLNAVKYIEKNNNRLYSMYGISKEKFTVLYAGNIGDAQGAEIILDTAINNRMKNIQFVIFGGGAGYERLIQRVNKDKIENVIINPLLPSEYVSEVYSLGSVALITCKKGTSAAGMPSKTWSIMACDVPIIASFDLNSNLAEILCDSNSGICVAPENVQELVNAIDSLRNDKQLLDKMKHGREYVDQFASKEAGTKKTISVLKESLNK